MPAEKDYVLFSKQGRRFLSRVLVDRQTYLPLVDLAQALDLSFSESVSTSSFNLMVGTHTIRLMRGRSLVQVDDQPAALPLPVLYVGTRWLVSPEFISRVLNRTLTEKIAVAPSGNRFAQGNISFNRINVFPTSMEGGSRLAIQFPSAQELEIQREGSRIVCHFGNAPVDPAREEFSFKDSCIQSIFFEELPTDSQLVVQLSDRPWHLRVTRLPSQNVCLLEINRAVSGPGSAVSSTSRNGATVEGSRPRGKWQRIILDPGHGGADTGVRLPNNLFEKDLALLYARRLKALLQSRLGGEVLLTRNADQELSLDERAGSAIRARGDLFLSLHIGNSFQAEELRTYAYVLKPRETPPLAQPVVGVPLPAEKTIPPLFLPWDETQMHSLDLSRRLAEILQGELNQQMNRGDRSLAFRHAPLRLLAPLPMPALLVEIGNARSLDFVEWTSQAAVQEAFGLAVLTAIDKFRNRSESP